MPTQPSPSSANDRISGASTNLTQMLENMANAELSQLPAGLIQSLKIETGLGNKEIPELTLEEKERILTLARQRNRATSQAEQHQQDSNLHIDQTLPSLSPNFSSLPITPSINLFLMRSSPDSWSPRNGHPVAGQAQTLQSARNTGQPVSSFSSNVNGASPSVIQNNPQSATLTRTGRTAPAITDSLTGSLFGSDLMRVADEFDTTIFRSDINFEREFGQWFNQPEDGSMELH